MSQSFHMQNHRFSYNEPMPVESCVQSICDLALRFGEDDEDGGDGGGSMVSLGRISSQSSYSKKEDRKLAHREAETDLDISCYC